MSLIIEDGTGPAGANSYASVERLRAFAAARNVSLPESEAACAALLIGACDYLETLAFAGQKVSATQALSWPRAGVTVEGIDIAPDLVPEAIVRAQLLLSLEASVSPLFASQASSRYSKARVADIEVTYRTDDENVASRSRFPVVEAMLSPFLVAGGMPMTKAVRV